MKRTWCLESPDKKSTTHVIYGELLSTKASSEDVTDTYGHVSAAAGWFMVCLPFPERVLTAKTNRNGLSLLLSSILTRCLVTWPNIDERVTFKCLRTVRYANRVRLQITSCQIQLLTQRGWKGKVAPFFTVDVNYFWILIAKNKACFSRAEYRCWCSAKLSIDAPLYCLKI